MGQLLGEGGGQESITRHTATGKKVRESEVPLSAVVAKRAWAWWDDSFHATAWRLHGGAGPSSRTRAGNGGQAKRLRKVGGAVVRGRVDDEWWEWSSDEEAWGGRAVRVLSDSESNEDT